MKKKIVLANLDIANGENYDLGYYPLGLSSIGPVIESCGVEVVYFDINIELEKKKQSNSTYINAAIAILKYKPDYVGFMTRCDILPRVLLCAKLIKVYNSKIKIILGGSGVSTIEKEVLEKFRYVDLIIRGEGENTVKELFDGGKLCSNIYNINGIAFADKKGIYFTSKRELIMNLDDLPYPKRLINKSVSDKKSIYIEAGRGCPYNCSFCSTSLFWERKYRVKTPSRLLNEIENMYLKGYEHFILIHDNLAVSIEYINALKNEFVQRNLPVTWSCSTRVDLVNEEKLSCMSQAGCTKIYFGIESGSQEQQRKIGKNLNVDVIMEKLFLCKKYKIISTRSFIIGFEGETSNDINSTLELAIRTTSVGQGTTQLHYLIPIAGTKATNAGKNKLVFDEKLITFLATRSDKIFIDDEERKLILDNPMIFSSFYKINSADYQDKYNLVYCFSHYLIYYPKLLNFFMDRDILPLTIWKYIKENCSDCYNCVIRSNESGEGGQGICTNPLKYFSELCNFSSVEQYIINYENEKRNYIINNQLYKDYKTI